MIQVILDLSIGFFAIYARVMISMLELTYGMSLSTSPTPIKEIGSLRGDLNKILKASKKFGGRCIILELTSLNNVWTTTT